MPISYQDDIRVFHLKGKSFSYCLHINETGELMNLYWGDRLPDGDITYIMQSYWDGASFDLQSSRFPREIPTRGMGYYGTPAVNAVNERGEDVTLLLYNSHSIYSGKRKPEGLPYVYTEEDGEATSLDIKLKDPLTALTVTVTYSVHEELDALTRSMKIENNGNAPLTLTHMLSASVPIYGRDYDIIHLYGAWARERSIERVPLGHTTVRVESQRGASGHEHNPFIALCDPNTDEHSGRIWGMTLVYSGSFVAQCEVSNIDISRLSIGLNPEVCRWRLAPGEAFQTPEAILSYYHEGMNGMSHIFHSVIRRRIVRGVWRDRPRPILLNNWEATYFNFNEQSILKIVEKAKQAGIELFVLDDGWFGKRDNDDNSLGDWVVNRKKLPCGIDGLAKKVNDMGLKFGLWFEPEMVSPDSNLYRAHPDWCLHAKGRERTEARQQLILDLSRVEVQDYIVEALSEVLGSANIGYVKWDMNRNMTEYFSAAATPEHQGEVQHRYILGLYRVLDQLTERFPEVLFEGCSGGGGRFDTGILYYMPQIWTSDDSEAVERLKIQYGTSVVYPPCTMGAHVSVSPNHQTRRVTGIKMRADVALSGNFGFELDLNKLTDEEFGEICKTVQMVKQTRATLQNGEFTRLESPFDSNYTAWQFVSDGGESALLCAFRRLSEPNDFAHRIFMKGLIPNATYRDKESGKEYLGAFLMHVGLPLPRSHGDFTSYVYRFQKI